MKSFDRLEESIKGMWCSGCDSKPRVAWGGSTGINDAIVRCNCEDGPTLVREEYGPTRKLREAQEAEERMKNEQV